MHKKEFKRGVEKHLTRWEMEPWELLYFKVCKSQLLVSEQTLETAGMMPGTNKSMGYSLEMISAHFLAGASAGKPSTLMLLPWARRAREIVLNLNEGGLVILLVES